MPSRIPTEELLDGIRELAEQLGRSPTMKEMENEGEYGRNTYVNRFGAWTDAVREAGYAPQRDYNVDREDLLKEIKRLRELTGETPRQADMDELGCYSAQMYLRRFGSWNLALGEVGLSPNRRNEIPDRELLQYLKDFKKELGRVPRCDDMTAHGEFAVNNYVRRFGTWNSALEQANLPKNVTYHGEHTDGLYGKYWKTRREGALERDSWRCQSCGKGDAEHIDEYGMGLEVHHIKPAHNFEDPDERHALGNLVTLCRECHNRWEGVELRPQLLPQKGAAAHGTDGVELQ